MKVALTLGFLGMIAVTIVGLINPRWILSKSTRAKTFGANLLFLLIIIIAAGAMAPKDEPQHAQTASTAQAPAARVDVKGIGINRAQASVVLAAQGCSIAKSSDTHGQERWLGQQGMVICEAIGPAHDLTQVYFLHAIAKDNLDVAMSAFAKTHNVVKLAAPEWKESGGWLAAAIKKESDVTVQNGRKIEVQLLKPLGLAVTVSSVQ